MMRILHIAVGYVASVLGSAVMYSVLLDASSYRSAVKAASSILGFSFLIALYSIIQFIASVIIAERYSIRNFFYYVATGAATSAIAVGVIMSREAFGAFGFVLALPGGVIMSHEGSGATLFVLALPGGVLSGIVYWAVAGRTCGLAKRAPIARTKT